MSTVEKLFVQIFERKNSIIHRVKQQTDFYTQHLASKLLADGIPPPPWLWNPSQSSDVQKVLNKEELISEILLPHPQAAPQFSSALCSQYNNQVVAGDNGELLVGLSKDIYSYNRGDIEDRETIAASCHDNNTRCTVNSVPEQDLSVNSPPQDVTEARISNIFSAPDQSLARIQRSKSRQKALELRYSGKAEAKNRSSQKNFSIGSSAKNRQLLSGSEKEVDTVNDSQELVESCFIRHENFGVGESNKGDSNDKEEAITCSTGKSTRLENAEEASSGVNSPKLDDCSGGSQKDDSTLVQYEEEFLKCADCVNELPEVIIASDVIADTCGEARVEDCGGRGTNGCDGRISQPSSSQNNGPEVDISIYSAKGNGGILVHSLQQFDNASHSEDRTKPSEGITLERIRFASNDKVLPTVPYSSSIAGHRDEVAYSSCTQKSLEKNEVQKMSSDEAMMCCPDPCNISHHERNIEAVDANELISHDLVKDPPVNSRSIIDHARSEHLVSKTSPDCFIFLSPKQLVFDDSEEYSLDKCFSLNLENRMLEKSPKKTFGIPPNPPVTTNDFSNSMAQKPSSAEPQKSSEADEFCRDSFESTCEEHSNIQLKEYSSRTNEHSIVGTSNPDSKIVPLAQNSNLEVQTDMTHSNAFEASELEDHVNLNCTEVCKSTPELQTGKDQCGTRDKEKSTSASNASKRKHLKMDYNMGENNDDLSKLEEHKIGRNSQPCKMGSWPRTKRRNTEDQDQEIDSCSAPPSYHVGMHYCSQTDCVNLEKARVGIEATLDYASSMNDSTNEDMRQKVVNVLDEEVQPLTKLQCREVALCSGELSEHQGSSSSVLLQGTVPILSSLGKEAPRVSEECLDGELEMPLDLEKDNDEQDKVLDNVADTDSLTCTERTALEGKSCLAEDGQLSHYLERSLYKRDLELNGVNQSLPELEGFIMDSESENSEISASQVNFDELVLPRTSLERVSILEKICKSASQQALSTEFSPSLKLHGLCKPYQSVPNGLLECIDLTRISAFNKDADKEVRAKCMDDVNGSLEVPSYSACLPYSGFQFGWASNPYSSPVGKQWEKMSLHSGSSGKTLGSNPELTCFPIEEDPSVSEESDNVCDEESDEIQENIVSSINTSVKQAPLTDMTGACLNALSPVAAADKFLSKGSVSSVTKNATFNNNHSEAKRSLGNHGSDKSLEKENDILSLGGNGIKKSEGPRNSRFSKVNSSCKNSSRRKRNKLSEKEPKRNNIVSNVTSFIPLVQQKQAAAQGAGKREIKVKSLEAAEAAKRLQEKKANERKMRKEALKIERARLGQENLRQMELEKKRKEEERKKRDVDIAAKKRQREEEEKKEKERKRKRLVEARQQQREDGKLRLEKAKQLSVIGENGNRIKEANNESKWSQVLLKETRDNVHLEKLDTKLRPDGFTNHVQDAGISIEACRTSTDSSDHQKVMSAFNSSPKTDTMAVKKIQEKSYEISPYQCSDDEEEEEEEIPNKKFVPSWTSKSNLALALPLQQGIDPDTIFPPDSFCSTEEVLVPRKPLLHKQLVT